MNIHMKGSVRVSQAEQAAAFVALTNNGMFEDITRNGVGDSTLDIDDDYRMNARDVFEGQIEGATVGSVSVVRTSETQVQVLTFDGAGAAADLEFSLTCSTVFIG